MGPHPTVALDPQVPQASPSTPAPVAPHSGQSRRSIGHEHSEQEPWGVSRPPQKHRGCFGRRLA